MGRLDEISKSTTPVSWNPAEAYAAQQVKEQEALEFRRKSLQENPFDPRTEVSADAKHIASRVVTHLWILFVALPVVLGIMYSLMVHH